MTIGSFSVTLVQAFIGLIFLVGMVEALIKFINYAILDMEEKTEQVLGYILSFTLGFFIAKFADYHFLGYFDIEFQHNWMNWLASGSIIGAGTGFLERKFDLINLIPHIVSGVSSNIKTKKTENDPFISSEVNYKDKYGSFYDAMSNEDEIGGEVNESNNDNKS